MCIYLQLLFLFLFLLLFLHCGSEALSAPQVFKPKVESTAGEDSYFQKLYVH